jgi:hypothetical protein
LRPIVVPFSIGTPRNAPRPVQIAMQPDLNRLYDVSAVVHRVELVRVK